MKKQRVIAAIDFGTHGTGFAWTTVEERHKDPKRRQIWFRTRWQDHPVPYPKNLTALLLDEEKNVLAWGYEARRKWAIAAAQGRAHEHEYVHGFKMSMAADAVNEEGKIPGDRFSPEDSKTLVSIYLRSVYHAAMEEIERSGYTRDEVQWCLTVPAIWNDYQKQLMREAAVAAGLPDDEKRLQLVIEPEAAAYHARVSGVRTIRASGGRASLMSKGSRFLVADCGGGTVDITAYRTDSRNRLEEIGRDYGGKHGSEYVNQAFVRRILSKRLGSYDEIQRIQSQAPSSLLDLVDNWEKAKLSLTTTVEDDLYLPLPAALDRLLTEDARSCLAGQQNGITEFIVVTAEEARGIFDEVIPNILQLVDKQLEEMRLQRRNAPGRELVILVGGFGNSPYLQEKLQGHLSGRADLLVPPEPQVSVLMGAVHYAYDPQTKARRTKYTYGCGSSRDFRNGIDPDEYKITLPGGKVKCQHVFNRFVQTGQSVPVDEEVTRSYSPLREDQTKIGFELYATKSKFPRYVTEPGCSKIGEVEVDLAKVMHLPFEKRSVKLAMSFGEVQIRATATVVGTGESVIAHVKFDSME